VSAPRYTVETIAGSLCVVDKLTMRVAPFEPDAQWAANICAQDLNNGKKNDWSWMPMPEGVGK
jgi:hypothetical protein